MANKEHLAILKQGVEAWNKWRKENPDIVPDLWEANLREADLSGADLRGANLFAADLFGTNFSGACLSWADIRQANLREAVLSGAELSGACLSGACLSEANLNGAHLRDADLCDANLSGANVEGAEVGDSVFGGIDLSVVKGLDTVRHEEPSTVGIDTLYLSRGKIPEVFLRGCGVPDQMIAFIASLAGQPETNRTQLRLSLTRCFSDSELRDLCFDMNVDYESLSGDNKADKTRELIIYCERRQMMPTLLVKCKELRPELSWEGEYE